VSSIYRMNRGAALNYVLFGMAILGILVILGGYKETFLSPGIYPESDTKGLLFGDYKMKKNPGLSDMSASTAWKLYPSYAVGSYEQTTNNKRYWPTPCNGWTTPSDMCGGLYQKKSFDIEAPKSPPWGCLRVNYYCTS